jgi:uncharacterized membrane protein (DUF106 family)
MADDVEKKIREMTDFRKLFMSSIVSALALVVGLFWNDAIRSAIEEILPQGEGLFYKFVAAVMVTVIVVLIIYFFAHSQKVAEKRMKELKERRMIFKEKITVKKPGRKKGLFF